MATPTMGLARIGAALWRLLTDVRFAVLLITLLALSGLVGMLIRQFPITAADDPARYAAELATMHAAWDSLPAGSFIVDSFDTLGLFSVFSTPWFLLLTAFAGINQWLYVLVGACPASLVMTRLLGLKSTLYPKEATSNGANR